MRAIVTVLGKDRTGIIATVSSALYARQVNILDISQTVLQSEFFTMVMLVDLSQMTGDFAGLKQAMQTCAEELGMEIQLQREEIFQSMHRI